MKNKHIIIAFFILLFSGALYSFAKIPYYPKGLIVKSEQFIHFLNKNDLKSAYELTTKKGNYYNFSSPQLFKKVVNRQAYKFIKAKDISVIYRSNFPFQTYGNRIRRWFTGRELNPKQRNIDFLIHVDGKTNISSGILFEVRWELQVNKNWQISFFQSHAG